MGGVLHLVQRGGAWAGWGPAQSLLAVPNVTAHPSTRPVHQLILFDVALLPLDSKGLNGYTSWRYAPQSDRVRSTVSASFQIKFPA